ncbi:MAG: ATP synthase F0 subunit B [Endomicrobium sp.]|jgi:F-type H+-transporting ATPase subunit b|nr:ATP synthase F0 subunit B [Endomicrobium sp.]
MKFINKFGLDPYLFLFQIINFSIVVFVLQRFLLKPLKKIFNERKFRIEQSLIYIEEAKIILENANKEKQCILEEAKNNAAMLTTATRVSIDESKKQAAIDAKKYSEYIVGIAKQKATIEFENMTKQLEKISTDVSEKIMLKILSNLFTNNEKQVIISRVMEKINGKIAN